MTEATPPVTLVGRLRRWLPLVSLLGSVAVFAYHLPTTADGDWSRLGWSALDQGWPLLILVVVGFGLRGVSTLQLVGAVMTGFFTSVWLADAGGNLATDIMGEDDSLRLTLAIPVIEETVKLIPLVAVAFVSRFREDSPGVLDLGLLGLATGGGFALHEDALWSRLSGDGFEGIGWLLPSVHSETGLVAGHAVWTALVGLAMGAALGRRSRVWRLLPVAALALVVADHGTWNSEDVREGWSWVTADGWAPIALTLGGFAAALVWDTRRVRAHTADDRLSRREVFEFAARSGGQGSYAARNRLQRTIIGGALLRMQARLAYGESAASPTPQVDAG